jgi:hypothetical protein
MPAPEELFVDDACIDTARTKAQGPKCPRHFPGFKKEHDMPYESSTVAIFGTHTDAEAAIRNLQKSGFNMKNLSILGKDFTTEEHAVGFYNIGDRVKVWGKLGAFWGSIMAMVFGSALLFIPVVGHIIVLGPLASTFIEFLGGAAIGGSAGVLGGALASAGIPKDSVVRYEREIKAGRFLVVAHGTAAEVEAARELLSTSAPIEVTSHAAAHA